MSSIPITRIAYQERQEKLKLAAQALTLLEKKQTVLLEEIRKSANQFLAETTSMAQITNRARYALSQAEAVLGEAAVRSVAFSSKRSLPLEIRYENMMGVRVPDIHLKHGIEDQIRKYALTNTSLLIDEVAETSSAEVHALIRLANRELRLKKLMDEYRRTFRRLKTIETILIPRLKRESEWIRVNLEERERGDYYRLKRAKRQLKMNN